MIPPTNNWK